MVNGSLRLTAPGLERSLVGLTLLEAASVGGEELAADALANAIGPVFRAPRFEGRIAVAMSGGVDSAVALLKSLPNAIGVTLRLWLDPDGPDAERACCSPDAVLAARATCHALGVPHVTLDLREEFRRAVVDPFVRGLRARGDAEPVHPLQRRLPLRAAARFRTPRRRRQARDRPLRTHRRAPGTIAARPRCRPLEGPVVHAREDRSHEARPHLVPARRTVEGRDASRGGARRACSCAPRGEPGSLLPRRRRLSQLPRASWARR